MKGEGNNSAKHVSVLAEDTRSYPRALGENWDVEEGRDRISTERIADNGNGLKVMTKTRLLSYLQNTLRVGV